MLDTNTFIFVAVAAAFVVVGVLAWLVDSGLEESAKAKVKYSLFALVAGVLGLFFLISDDSEFQYSGWTPTQKEGRDGEGGMAGGGGGGGGGKQKAAGGGGGGGGMMDSEDEGSSDDEGVVLQDGAAKEAGGATEPEIAKADDDEDASKQDCPKCPEIVTIRAGTALIGSARPMTAGGAATAPASSVTLRRNYGIGKYEITVEQFRSFVQETGFQPAGVCKAGKGGKAGGSFERTGFKQKDTSPVVCVSYEDALAYTDYLTNKTGVPYRLPTEVEWEYAARAGHLGAYPSEEPPTGEQANFAAPLGPRLGRTAEVGSYPANGNGMHDVQGNVWEMTSDCWSPDYLSKGARAGGDPSKIDCKLRVAKGGAWFSAAEHLNFAMRVGIGTRLANNGLGFRVVREDQAPVKAKKPVGKVTLLRE